MPMNLKINVYKVLEPTNVNLIQWNCPWKALNLHFFWQRTVEIDFHLLWSLQPTDTRAKIVFICLQPNKLCEHCPLDQACFTVEEVVNACFRDHFSEIANWLYFNVFIRQETIPFSDQNVYTTKFELTRSFCENFFLITLVY